METEERTKSLYSFLNKENNILITTNLGSRGLNHQNVFHVIQFNFAKTFSDYVHRIGRLNRSDLLTSISNKNPIKGGCMTLS